MKPKIWLIIAAVFATTGAGAAESMRCSHRLVTDGDHKAKVADLCGDPSYKEQRTIFRAGVPRRDLNVDGGDTNRDRELLIHDRSLVEVAVDVWVYNRGRTRLMREVVFQDGRVVEINLLSRGY